MTPNYCPYCGNYHGYTEACPTPEKKMHLYAQAFTRANYRASPPLREQVVVLVPQAETYDGDFLQLAFDALREQYPSWHCPYNAGSPPPDTFALYRHGFSTPALEGKPLMLSTDYKPGPTKAAPATPVATPVHPLAVDQAEFDTILGALRYYQHHAMGDPANRPGWLQEIVCPGEDSTSLDADAIDRLCERLNTAGPAPDPDLSLAAAAMAAVNRYYAGSLSIGGLTLLGECMQRLRERLADRGGS